MLVGEEGLDGSSTLDAVVVDPDTSGGLPAKKVSKTFLNPNQSEGAAKRVCQAGHGFSLYLY